MILTHELWLYLHLLDSLCEQDSKYWDLFKGKERVSDERSQWCVFRALSFMAAYHRPGMAHSQWADWRSRQQKGERQAHKRKLSHILKRCSESERVGGSGPWKPWQDSILMHKQKS